VPESNRYTPGSKPEQSGRQSPLSHEITVLQAKGSREETQYLCSPSHLDLETSAFGAIKIRIQKEVLSYE
jgi:hypothetical protein